MRRFNALRRALFVLCGGGVLALMLVAAPLAVAGGTAYTAETPVVDTIEGGPWNTSQGDASAGSLYQRQTCCRRSRPEATKQRWGA